MNFITDDLPLMSCVSMPDGTKPEQVAVFLHGYGANGRDLFDISTYLRRVFPNAAFYFPFGRIRSRHAGSTATGRSVSEKPDAAGGKRPSDG